jgi:hypothetical protein
VQAREGAQAAALLDDRVRGALCAFAELALDDQGGVGLHKGGVYQVTGLQRFLGRCQDLAAHLDAASRRIPPPAAFAAAAGAWQQLAARAGASLRVGDMSLHGWCVKGVAMSLEHRWAAAQPSESVLWTERAAELDPAAFASALSSVTGRPTIFDDARVGMTIATVIDPRGALADAERLAEALTKLRAGAGRGPYR